jgi:hypothetical protein
MGGPGGRPPVAGAAGPPAGCRPGGDFPLLNIFMRLSWGLEVFDFITEAE